MCTLNTFNWICQVFLNKVGGRKSQWTLGKEDANSLSPSANPNFFLLSVTQQKHRDRDTSTAVLGIHGGLVPGSPVDTKIHGCSSPLYKMAEYLYINYEHPLTYFKSSLNYLQYLTQCKCYVNRHHRVANSRFVFRKILDFFPNIFDQWMIEFRDAEPMATEGRLYMDD